MTPAPARARETTDALPDAIVRMLDGSNLERGEGETFCLVTTGRDGWPHVALLSVGEVVAVAPRELRLALHAGSGSTAALEASERGTLLVVHDGAALTVRLRTGLLGRPVVAGVALACFRAGVEEVVTHRAGYAELETGPRFRLVERETTLARWRQTVAALLEAGAP